MSQAGFFLGTPVWNEAGQLADFRFTMVNQVWLLLSASNQKSLSGHLPPTGLSHNKKNGLCERFAETYLTGNRQQFDVHYLGETVEEWANIMTAKLDDEILGNSTDYTPIKQLQLELEKCVEEKSRSNASLKEFAYVTSYDLQEPLRKINFFSKQLRKKLGSQLNNEDLEKFERMQQTTNRIRNFIDDLLQYSKVSIKPSVYENIGLIVEQVLQDQEATILSTGAIVKVGSLLQVKGYERQLLQAFQNLISNALKYKKAEVSPVISIDSQLINESDPKLANMPDVKKGDYRLIEISDNGIGFEPEQAEKIFQVFQRLHGCTQFEGSGVGLAIVQKVITNHKGFIKAKGLSEQGAQFYIILPVSTP